MAKKKVIDLDTYSALDAYAISMHEFYKALRRAGFAVDLCLGIITERSVIIPRHKSTAKPALRSAL